VRLEPAPRRPRWNSPRFQDPATGAAEYRRRKRVRSRVFAYRDALLAAGGDRTAVRVRLSHEDLRTHGGIPRDFTRVEEVVSSILRC